MREYHVELREKLDLANATHLCESIETSRAEDDGRLMQEVMQLSLDLVREGYTQQEIADRTGVFASQISRWLRGHQISWKYFRLAARQTKKGVSNDSL